MSKTLAPGIKPRASALRSPNTEPVNQQAGTRRDRNGNCALAFVLLGMAILVVVSWALIQLGNWGLNVWEGWREGDTRSATTFAQQGGSTHQVTVFNVGGELEVVDMPVNDLGDTQVYWHRTIKDSAPKWPGDPAKADVAISYEPDGTYTLTMTANEFDLWSLFHRQQLTWKCKLSNGTINVLESQLQ